MTITPDELRSRLQNALTEASMDATQLARTINRSPDYVRDFINGRKNSFKANDLAYMEAALSVPNGYFSGLSVSDLANTKGPDYTKLKIKIAPDLEENINRRRGNIYADADVSLPVYSAAEGDLGVMVVSTDPIDRVTRPWFMREVRDGFAVLIVGDSMEPAFEPGDLAIVNPRLPAMRNRTMIFTTERGGGEFKATIKRLIRWTSDAWCVRQYNEPRDFELDRHEWPDALRVVGKLEG